MSIFSGVVAIGQVRPRRGAAKSLLSAVVAPTLTALQEYNDANVDIALQHNESEVGFYSDERFVVVSDCRLDNVGALCQQLSIPREKINTGLIIATAFARWGDAIVEQIAGDFAFAIWDRNNRSLFCARDRFGRIPIAYLLTQNGIVFASDFLPVATCFSKLPAVNDAWIIEYIHGVVADHESTPFNGVKRIPPGFIARWHDGEFRLRKYWDFSEIASASENISVSTIASALELSIERRVKSPDTFTMLSGGLDSSTIAILARDARRLRNDDPLSTVSLVFDGHSQESERPFIEAVLKQGGFEPHFVHAKPFDPIAEVQRLMRVHGAPTLARGAPTFNQAIARAQELGFTNALDGHGGDEIISSFGQMRLFELAQQGRWGTLLHELIRTSRNSRLNVVNNFVGFYATKGTGLSANVVRGARFHLQNGNRPQWSGNLLKRELIDHPSVRLSKEIAKASNPSRHESERSHHESILSGALQSQGLEFIYRQFRSHGIRIELPFWDYDVVELCLRVPSHQKLKEGVPRSLIRSVMSDRLPASVVNRTSKYDFSDWFLQNLNTSSEAFRQLHSTKNHRIFDYVDPNVFGESINRLNDKNRDVRLRASTKIWTVLNLFVWFDMVESMQSKHKDPLEVPC